MLDNKFCEVCPGTLTEHQICGGVEGDYGGPVVATIGNDRILAGVTSRGVNGKNTLK